MKNTRGFTLIEALLILVIVGLLGGVGWYVYNANNKARDTYSNAANSDVPKYTLVKSFAECKAAKDSKIQESFPEVCVTKAGKKFTNPEQAKESKEISNWLLFEPPSKEYQVRIPDGWKLIQSGKTNFIYAWDINDLKTIPGKRGTVTSIEGGRDGGSIAFALSVLSKSSEGYDSAIAVQGTKNGSFKSYQGLDVERYYFLQTKKPDGVDLPLGSKAYSYLLSKGDMTAIVIHDENVGEPNLVSLIEKVIRTIELR